MFQTRFLLFFLLITISASAQIVDKQSERYNEVIFLATHNSYNSKVNGLKFPNQYLSISDQLEFGVRAFMFDLYLEDSNVVEYHGKKMLGQVSFSETLDEIRQFMEKDSAAVITLILESYVSGEALEQVLKKANLFNALFCKKDSLWPTLDEMIQSGKRLVVFSEKREDSEQFPWNHYAWNYIADTPYQNYRIRKLNESVNRGKVENDLFLLNHFVYANKLGVGSRRKARKINRLPVIAERIGSVQKKYNRTPNFVAVDFFTEEMKSLKDGLALIDIQ